MEILKPANFISDDFCVVRMCHDDSGKGRRDN